MTAGNYILIGLMGAGKTTVGRHLARLTGRTFHDSDHEVESRTGVRVTTIFEIEGENRFREREKAVIAELMQRDGIVLATGGGAVLDPDNRAALKAGGTVIYLRATIDDLLIRTAHDKSRPLLQTGDPRAKLEALFAVRDPLYREIADVVVDTSRQNVGVLVQRLLAKLKETPES
ncbi:shikimate kinase [Microvirgula aerodenitrificans]|uniref:shikimate kinase n=1 Tax=Microvirgula aerodenitrificans TaxID=57480 RepID=UPI00048BD98B|nr:MULTISPECIES: shikimate kinase [Microvirgula]RAS15605.1 shikimate kinase [Microvirgula sp. AG722]